MRVHRLLGRAGGVPSRSKAPGSPPAPVGWPRPNAQGRTQRSTGTVGSGGASGG